MSAVTVAEMRAMEARAAEQGWSEDRLLTHAGQRLGHALAAFFPTPGTLIAYLGKGHNAGDAIVAMRVMAEAYGWHIAARAAWPPADWAALTREKWLEGPPVSLLEEPPDWRVLRRPLVLLDGLLGIGATVQRYLRVPAASDARLTRHRLRRPLRHAPRHRRRSYRRSPC